MAEKEKIITVWGSPHSGKTTFAFKLAQSLYERSRASRTFGGMRIDCGVGRLL